MKMTLTEAQLLHEWRLRAFPEPVSDGLTVTRRDGVDAPAVLTAGMKDWYYSLPTELRGTTDVTEMCSRRGTGTLLLPEGMRTVTRVSSDEWEIDAVIACEGSREAMLQQSEYTQGSVSRPVAVVSGSEVRVWPPAERVIIEGVVDLADRYIVDTAAFATITPYYRL